MTIPSELLSQFVKVTDHKPNNSKETTVYGTIVKNENGTFVKLDGAGETQNPIPVSSTVNVNNDDRVTVMIKDHTAVVTGNLGSPSVNSSQFGQTSSAITQMGLLLADKVDADQLDVEIARIDDLFAENAEIKQKLVTNEAEIGTLTADTADIKERLTAAEADIEDLSVTKLDVDVAKVTYATIQKLEAAEADIYSLEATHGNFVKLTADNFNAVNADINNLKTSKLDAEVAEIMKADITKLNADTAAINTLIFGSATGDTIQTSFANAVIAQLGDAQIKSAMIESLTASKLTAGDINTNKVRVKSEDGSLVISDETMQISDKNRVRVQIGKDASGDYSINIWDQNGSLMFSKGGITDSAIKEAIIRNDMVSDTANIAAHKLDIDSLFEEINGSTKTIKSSKIYLDDEKQTLDVAFKTMTEDVDGLEETVSTQGTQLSAVQGQIASKVWQQDINTAINNIQVGGRNLYIIKNSSEGFLLVGNTNLGEMNTVRREHTSEYIPVQASEQYIFQVWTTVDELDTEDPCLWMAYDLYDSDKIVLTNRPAKRTTYTLPNGQCYGIYEITVPSEAHYIRVSARFYSDGLVKLEKGNVPTEWSPAPEDVEDDITTLSTRYSTIEQTIGGISTTVAEHTSKINEKADSSTVTNVSDKVSKLEQNLTGFQATVTDSYATKNELESAETRLNTAIQVSANGIQSSVSSTYATKDSVNNIEVGGRNLYIEKTAVDGYLSSSGDGAITAAGPVTKEKTSDYIPVTPGDEMRFQLWVTTPTDSYIWYAYQFFIEDGTTLNTNRPALHLYETTGGYYHVTYDPIVVPANAVYMRVSARMFNDGKIKVERGNKPTDWTPAPEDMATDDDVRLAQSTAEGAQETATNAETLVKQLSDSISMLVTDGNGTSLMTQTEDGWTFSTADIQKNVSDIAQNLSALTSEVGDTNNAVDVLEQAVSDLGEIAEYVKIGTYDGEPCIELGESDSEFKMRITNTRILFMEGSNVVAHISNQSLHIKKAVIEEELQQGDFVWQMRSNGNLGLIWKGVSS